MVSTRMHQVRELLQAVGVDGVLIRSQANLSWLFNGRYHVNLASEAGLATVLVTRQNVTCIVSNIEHRRLLEEEGIVCDTVHVVPWYDESATTRLLANWIDGKNIADDTELASEFRALRSVFQGADAAALRRLGHAVATAVESVCRDFQQGETEFEIAARLAAAQIRLGIDPVVVLVGGERRALHYRHLLPTDEKVNRYGILSTCGRRNGVVMSVTRMVHFGTPDEDLVRRHRAVLEVDAAFLAASRPGQTLGSVLDAGRRAYGELGYPDEWQAHHQGGLAGYQSREERALPESKTVLQPGHCAAWNPSIAGVKSEDTILIEENGVEIITQTGQFPTVPVAVHGCVTERPGLLVR